ncbi:helix-turn-helix transcriptional regulator [Thiovibrio sp. JS02]
MALKKGKNWEEKVRVKKGILAALQQGDGLITQKQICRDFGISQPTFYRYLDELRQELRDLSNDIELVSRNDCEEAGTYRLKVRRNTPAELDSYGRVKVDISREEKRALALICHLFDGSDEVQTPERKKVGDHLHCLLNKLLANETNPYELERYSSEVVFSANSTTGEYTQLALLFTIYAAILENVPLDISYLSKETGKKSSRIIDPYYLEMLEGEWRLRAYCRKKKALRTFALHSISSCKVVDGVRYLDRDELPTPAEDLARAFGPYMDIDVGDDEEIVVRFTEKIRHQVENLSGRRYRIKSRKVLPRGGVEVVFVVNHIYLVEWLRRFLPEIEYISHDGLRKTLVEKILQPQISKLTAMPERKK